MWCYEKSFVICSHYAPISINVYLSEQNSLMVREKNHRWSQNRIQIHTEQSDYQDIILKIADHIPGPSIFPSYIVLPYCPRTVAVYNPVYPGCTSARVHTTDHLYISRVHVALLVILSRICLTVLHRFLHAYCSGIRILSIPLLPIKTSFYTCERGLLMSDFKKRIQRIFVHRTLFASGFVMQIFFTRQRVCLSLYKLFE